MGTGMKVSVIISNRNDVAMLSVTVRSCLEELKPLGPGAGEVVICDNSDDSIKPLLDGAIPSGYYRDKSVKLYHQPFPCLFTARETAAKKASGDYIICVDSHMIIGRNMIRDLVTFMDRRVDNPRIGFAHAPISWCHQHESRARHDRNMDSNELGPWGTAYKRVRRITWKGMPWICRRSWFLNELGAYGALSQHKLSWGGGDMHIGIKPWLLGYENWAVPTSPGIHIGPFPKVDTIDGEKDSAIVGKHGDGYKYRLWANSGVGPHAVGFLVSCYVLGGEAMMKRNKDTIQERFGRYIKLDEWWDKAIEFGKDEKAWLDERKVMTFEQLLKSAPWKCNAN